MSSHLENFLLGAHDDLQPEMRPDRVFSGLLDAVTIRVRITGKGTSASGSPVEGAACGQSADLTSVLSGRVGPADMRSFLRWLGDSLDNDVATLNLEVTGAEADSAAVQGASRRLGSQAFA